MSFPLVLCALALGAASILAAPVEPYNATLRFDPSNFKVASIRAPPAGWIGVANSTAQVPATSFTPNLTATALLGAEYIMAASADGAGLVIFPETWFPGYPQGDTSLADYFNQSLVLGSPEWDIIVRAVKAAQVYVAIGMSERNGDYLYMGQVLFSPEGDKLIHRHKLRPSGGERSIWSDGYMDQLAVVSTPYGRMGMLECYEHFHPSMTVPMQAQKENIHIGSFPFQTDYGVPPTPADYWWYQMEVNGASGRVYAVEGQTNFFFTSIGVAETYNTSGSTIAYMSMYDTAPYMMTSLNTTAFTVMNYDIESQESWGLISQLTAGWPATVPKENGTFFNHQKINFPAFMKGWANATEISTGILNH